MKNEHKPVKNILLFFGMGAILVGIFAIAGGIFGATFTYVNIASEKITTPADASIPNTPVSGPLTLLAQAKVIRKHMLTMSGGKTYAEMSRTVQKLDSDGALVFNEDGSPLMIPNEARNTWITATTLTTALNLGILAYAFSAFIVVIGFMSILEGVMFISISRLL